MHATVNVTDSSEAVDIRNFINKKMVTVQRCFFAFLNLHWLG